MDVSLAPNAPARSRLATRARLLRAATALFAERGLHRVTSHDIARAAGVAAGTFYLHFRDKADLYRHIVFEALTELSAEMQRAAGDAPDAHALLTARAETIVSFAERNRDVVRILFSHETESAAVEADAMAHLAAGLETRLRREQTEGSFPRDLDPAVSARAMLGMTAHLIDWWTQDPARATRESVVHTLVSLQFSGIRSERPVEE